MLLSVAAPFIARGQMHLTLPVVLSALALGILGTGAAYAVNYRLIEDLGATRASVVTYLLPIVAVTLGATVLSEPVTWNLIAGTLAVILGVALVEGRLGAARSVDRLAM